MGLRSEKDPIPEGERIFMMASDIKAIDENDTPMKVKHFVKGEENG